MTDNRVTVIVRPRKTDFARGLKYARSLGGRYVPEDQVWALPRTASVRRSLRAPANYGLEVVQAPEDTTEAWGVEA